MAVVATTEPAEGARERLAAFVGEVVAGMAHVRQRANALVYVRGLIEHGGRKSLQPTLLRQGESAARYESLQQFLADSPWDPSTLVRACAERVGPELDVQAWVIELDYRQLKGELGLDHYEGRSYAGWHHHCALVTCAHAFLTSERLCPPARRPV